MKKRFILLLAVIICAVTVTAYAWDKGGWDSLRRFLAGDHTWTGEQSYTDGVKVVGGATVYNTSLSGNTVFSVDGAGTGMFGNKLGVGIAPTYSIDTTGSGDYAARFATTGSSYAGFLVSTGVQTSNPFVQFHNSFTNKFWTIKMTPADVFHILHGNALPGNEVLTINASGNVGIGTTSGFLSGATSHMVFASGVSPTGTVTNGAGFYVVGGQMWAVSSDGTHNQLTSHDPETNRAYSNSFNSFTGVGKKIYHDNGEVVTYQVEKLNPETVAKQKWVDVYQAENKVIVADAKSAIETVTIDEDVETRVEEEKTRYSLDGGKIVSKVEKIATPVKTKVYKQVTRLKYGHSLDPDTGKVYRKPTKEEAEHAALTGFAFDWSKQPKFIRDAWGK